MLLRLFPNCNTHRSGQFIQLAAQGYAAMTGGIHWRYNRARYDGSSHGNGPNRRYPAGNSGDCLAERDGFRDRAGASESDGNGSGRMRKNQAAEAKLSNR